MELVPAISGIFQEMDPFLSINRILFMLLYICEQIQGIRKKNVLWLYYSPFIWLPR